MKLIGPIFYSQDIDAAVVFYKALGLELVDLDGNKFARLAFLDGNKLGIKASTGGREKPGSQTMMLKVEDIERQYKDILSKKLAIIAPLKEQPWGKTFIVTDPDGNWIEYIA